MANPSILARFLGPIGSLSLAVGAAAATSASAEVCPAEPRAALAAAQWRQAQPIAALEVKGEQQVRCFRRAFVAALVPVLGQRVGYKVGFFSPAARRAYGIDQPRLGELYSGMLIPEGDALSADFGYGGVWESDLLLVVGNERINDARSREEAYLGLRGIRPFIELTSRNYGIEITPTADQVTALNLGARQGVVGTEQALEPMATGFEALSNLSIDVIVKESGVERSERVVAREALGDLLEIVLFARDAVHHEGGRLRAGDVISVGVFTPARAPRAGQVVTLRYNLRAQPASVSAAFR